VLSPNIHVLLFVFTTWCDGYEALEREVTALATRWQDEEQLRVATFDAGHNDLPRQVHIERLPSLILVRGGTNEGIDLSHLRTERELSDALVAHTADSAAPLRRPVDLQELGEAIELLPRLQREMQLLLAENARLRSQLAQARSAPHTVEKAEGAAEGAAESAAGGTHSDAAA
jgi:hypothetical protein